MSERTGVPSGTLVLLILRLLRTEPLHGYAIAQRIAQLSNDQLTVEEGSLYPALQKMLLKGWVRASNVTSESGRTVRQYKLTAAGARRLQEEQASYEQASAAIAFILAHA